MGAATSGYCNRHITLWRAGYGSVNNGIEFGAADSNYLLTLCVVGEVVEARFWRIA